MRTPPLADLLQAALIDHMFPLEVFKNLRRWKARQ